MGKNKEYSQQGLREWYSKAGCHSCLDCKHLELVYLNHINALQYKCKVKPTMCHCKYFPYDNTKCSEFEENV